MYLSLYNCTTSSSVYSMMACAADTRRRRVGKSLCMWWRLCWVLVSVSQMAVRVSPCWRCLRTASPCHSPPSSQVSAGWTGGRGSTATYRQFTVTMLPWEAADGSAPNWMFFFSPLIPLSKLDMCQIQLIFLSQFNYNDRFLSKSTHGIYDSYRNSTLKLFLVSSPHNERYPVGL